MTWNTIPLKRISTFTAGGTPSVDRPDYWADDGDGYPWVAISDMSSVDAVATTARRVNAAGLHAARIQLGKPGTILFSMYASLGHTAWLVAPAAWNQAILGLWPDATVDARFLRYCLVSIRSQLLEQARSNTQSNLNAEVVGNLRVPYPPLDEQHRIADFLDAETARVDRMAELRTSQMEALGMRYQSHLSEVAQVLCDRYGTVRVRHVLQRIEQGWSPQCEDRTIMDGEWGVVKAGCVNGGVFDATQHKVLPVDTQPERRYRLRTGDLLMSRASGSADLIGSIAVLPDDLPSQLLLCDKVYRLRMDRTRMIPCFVAFMLRTLQVREQIKLGISGAEGMANNLPTATVTNLPLPDVPLEEQAHVASDLGDAWRVVQDATQMLKQQLGVLSERRLALITAAVTGQSDVTRARGVAV